jgi:DsbC/DsbD-like thiol-disulfide interchange protein
MRPGWRTAEGTHMAALHLRLAEGWKTYWRAPGDAGIPPRFDWSGSENIASVAFHWPRPVVFAQFGIRSIGYRHELVLPIELTLRDPSLAARVETSIEIGVCETICLPVSMTLQADLPPGGTEDPRITTALAERPKSARTAGLEGLDCTLEPIADGMRVTARLDIPQLGRDEIAVFELSDKSVWISESNTVRDVGRLTAQADLVPMSGAPFALDRSDLRITILGDDNAAELRGCPSG